MNVLRCKDGVVFNVPPTPAGMKILSALVQVANHLQHDLTITSWNDGAHSGPTDPHHLGSAGDVRTSDVPDKDALLWNLALYLCEMEAEDTPLLKDGGYVTKYFFLWIEDAGQPNEHLHVQLRKGMTYP